MKLTGSASTSYNISLRSAKQVLIISVMDIVAWILILAIVSGQLIKIPIGTHGGATLLDITVISLCLLGLWELKSKLQKPPIFILAAILFILIALFSLLITPLQLNQKEFFTSFSYIIRFSSFILLGWLIYLGIFPRLNKNIPQVLLYSGLGLATLGLLQFIFLPDLRFLTNQGWDPHYFRTASTFLDPNFLGSYLVLTLVLLFAHPQVFDSEGGAFYAQTRRGVLNRHPGILYVILVYLALLTTFSRGAYLAFLISFATLSILTRSIKMGLITLLLFSGLILGFTTYQQLVAQPRGIDRTQSAEFRLTTWQQGWQLFSSHPILGIGFNAYRYALKQYNLADEQFLKSHGASTNDSSILYVLATTGIIGLISYLLFLFSLFRINIVLTAGLMGLIIQSFFANTLFYPHLFIWLILMAAVHKK